MPTEPSAREVAQRDLAAHLNDHADYWTAPYGVIESTQTLGRGAVRTVTFGVARYLDATAYIWRADRIDVRAEGGLAYRVEGTFDSVQSVVDNLTTLYAA